MWDNKLFKRHHAVGGARRSSTRSKVPMLHAVAEHDHIVPYAAAKHLINKVSSTDKEEVMLKGGTSASSPGQTGIRAWATATDLVGPATRLT